VSAADLGIDMVAYFDGLALFVVLGHIEIGME
jgi:hypothetical protein